MFFVRFELTFFRKETKFIINMLDLRLDGGFCRSLHMKFVFSVLYAQCSENFI